MVITQINMDNDDDVCLHCVENVIHPLMDTNQGGEVDLAILNLLNYYYKYIQKYQNKQI